MRKFRVIIRFPSEISDSITNVWPFFENLIVVDDENKSFGKREWVFRQLSWGLELRFQATEKSDVDKEPRNSSMSFKIGDKQLFPSKNDRSNERDTYKTFLEFWREQHLFGLRTGERR